MILATHGEYDADNPEGSSPIASQYVSKKDAKWVLLIIVGLGLIFYPAYTSLKAQGEKATCSANFQAMYKAMALYAQNYDNRTAPIYEVGDNGSPQIIEGRPVVWATTIQPFMSPRQTFTCPSATTHEHTVVNGHGEVSTKPIPLTYGIYRGMQTVSLSELPAPDLSILLSETSNQGAEGSYNPIPFTTSKDEVVPYDGFVIGWDDSNFRFTAESQTVTRLAFRNTADGDFRKKGVVGRHSTGILAIFADGHLETVPPNAAILQRKGDSELDGYWRSSLARLR